MNTAIPVRIVTDSSCDLPTALVERFGITVVPLTVRFGDEEFVDGRDLDSDQFWDRCRVVSRLPQTAAPAPGDFGRAYDALGDAPGIVVITLSGALSATLQSARLAAEDRSSTPIEIVDSRTVSLGTGLIVLACAQLAATGADTATVARYARELVGRTRVIGALDTLEYLRRGGRIGNAQALLGSALSIKPIIAVIDGVVEQAGRQRTRTRALDHLVAQVEALGSNLEHLAVLHAQCSDVDRFVERLARLTSTEILVAELGPVIGTHAGPGTIGIAYITAR